MRPFAEIFNIFPVVVLLPAIVATLPAVLIPVDVTFKTEPDTFVIAPVEYNFSKDPVVIPFEFEEINIPLPVVNPLAVIPTASPVVVPAAILTA